MKEKSAEPIALQKLIVPIGSGVLLLIIIIVAISFVSGLWNDSGVKMADLSAENEFLQQKADVLNQVDDAVKKSAQSVYVAFPAINPSAQIVSQIKNAAVSAEVNISKIDVFSTIALEGEVSQVKVELEAEGASDKMLGFVLSLKDLSPMVSIDQSGIVFTSGNSVAKLSIAGFWSPLPKVLPAIADSIEPLSESEMELMDLMNELKQPEFGDQIDSEPQPPSSPRENPFASASQ